MYVTLTLQSETPSWEIPVNYNHLIQAAIYHSLSPEFAGFLHNEGYIIGNRRFALFAFSRLMGSSEYVPKSKTLQFRNPVRLTISSPVERFIHEISQIVLNDGMRIGNSLLHVTGIELESPRVEESMIEVATLSPVVAYSTMLRSDGRKFTVYFQPRQQDFQRIVAENLLRKAKLIYGSDVAFDPIIIRPINVHRKQIVSYKDTIIEAYSGRFVLEGDSRLLQAALDAGLGSKNSAGFGLVRPV